MNKIKKVFLALCLILALWVLFQVVCYGYWVRIAWGGPGKYTEMMNGMRELPSEKLIKMLDSFQLSSPYPSMARKVLVERKEKGAVPVFINRLHSRDRRKRRDAIFSLGVIGDPRAIGPLMEIIKKGEDGPNYSDALLALSQMKYEPVRPLVLERLKREDGARNGSLTMISYYTNSEDIPALESMSDQIKGDDMHSRLERKMIKGAIETIQEAQR